jgi:hypothetical protein
LSAAIPINDPRNNTMGVAALNPSYLAASIPACGVTTMIARGG